MPAPAPYEAIHRMFQDLAPRYDLFNHLTSMGMAARWRGRALKSLKKGMRVLDLGCGTGDLALAAAARLGGTGEVVGLDFSEKMLEVARHRCERMGLNSPGKVRWVLKRAEELPIEEEPYDLIVSGFVLRNMHENIEKILEGVYRSLKAGGEISFLDITEPSSPIVLFLWRVYMNTVAALYGKLLFGANYPAFYLTESAKRFLNPRQFAQLLERTGLRAIRIESYMAGAVTLYNAARGHNT